MMAKKKLKCWRKEKGILEWGHKTKDLSVSIMKSPGDKEASLVMGKGEGKETNPKTIKEARKKANYFMRKNDK